MTDATTKTVAAKRYPVPAIFVAWLEEDWGRGEYFQRIDPSLFPSIISKLKTGKTPITLETAIRIERAQKPSDKPLKAEELMTFVEHRALYRYATGQEPAPAPIALVRGKTLAIGV